MIVAMIASNDFTTLSYHTGNENTSGPLGSFRYNLDR